MDSLRLFKWRRKVNAINQFDVWSLYGTKSRPYWKWYENSSHKTTSPIAMNELKEFQEHKEKYAKQRTLGLRIIKRREVKREREEQWIDEEVFEQESDSKKAYSNDETEELDWNVNVFNENKSILSDEQQSVNQEKEEKEEEEKKKEKEEEEEEEEKNETLEKSDKLLDKLIWEVNEEMSNKKESECEFDVNANEMGHEDSVLFVMQESDVTRETAIQALKDHNNNVLDVIIALGFKT